MPPKFRRGGGFSSVRANERNGEDEEEMSLANAKRFAEIARRGELDTQMGFAPFLSGGARTGWMLNMQSVLRHAYHSLIGTDVCGRCRVAVGQVGCGLLLYGGGRQLLQGHHDLQPILLSQVQGTSDAPCGL